MLETPVIAAMPRAQMTTTKLGAKREDAGAKKSPQQIQMLEKFYSDVQYPKPEEMGEYATCVGLTYGQVRIWFEERRMEMGAIGPQTESRAWSTGPRSISSFGSSSELDTWGMSTAGDESKIISQVLFPKDYILSKIFCKDGPPLGSEFDPLPQSAHGCNRDITSHHSSENQRTVKKKKVTCMRATVPNVHPPMGCHFSVDNNSESSELQTELVTLVDDEELELSELQAGPYPLRCSAHLSSSGRHDRPLYSLAEFPPQSLKMKKLFSTKPWESSPEMVKKPFQGLFKFILLLFCMFMHMGTVSAGNCDHEQLHNLMGFCRTGSSNGVCCTTVYSIMDRSSCICDVLKAGVKADKLVKYYYICGGKNQAIDMLVKQCNVTSPPPPAGISPPARAKISPPPAEIVPSPPADITVKKKKKNWSKATIAVITLSLVTVVVLSVWLIRLLLEKKGQEICRAPTIEMAGTKREVWIDIPMSTNVPIMPRTTTEADSEPPEVFYDAEETAPIAVSAEHMGRRKHSSKRRGRMILLPLWGTKGSS